MAVPTGFGANFNVQSSIENTTQSWHDNYIDWETLPQPAPRYWGIAIDDVNVPTEIVITYSWGDIVVGGDTRYDQWTFNRVADTNEWTLVSSNRHEAGTAEGVWTTPSPETVSGWTSGGQFFGGEGSAPDWTESHGFSEANGFKSKYGFRQRYGFRVKYGF